MDWDAYLNLQYQLLLMKTRIMQVRTHTRSRAGSARSHESLAACAHHQALVDDTTRRTPHTQIYGSAGQGFDATGLVLPNLYAGMGTALSPCELPTSSPALSPASLCL